MSWGSLDLAPIGNCTVSALVDRQARFVWACVPRVDSDPMFCALLGNSDPTEDACGGHWSIDVDRLDRCEQAYVRNTPILVTRLTDADGAQLEITDFCPRHVRFGRTYRPTAFARIVRPVTGVPRIRVRLRAGRDWGAEPAARTWGSNHIRYLGSGATLRLTSNVPVGHVLDERWFRAEAPMAFFLGPDEPFIGDVGPTVQTMHDQTMAYWRQWVRGLATPVEWQSVVIRAAITLKLCMHEETGAIVAALTTSIPEAPDTERNWDYRYCWIRDAYYTVQALNRLGALDILENYLTYLRNIVDQARGGHIQPLYGVGFETNLAEHVETALPGYRGMGPVRVGNQAHEHLQHDVYGQIILSGIQAFFDQRLYRPAGRDDFEALERVAARAVELHDQPDAGLWEFRTRARVHTYSAMMAWAGCDRLANAALALTLPDRAASWRVHADAIRARILREAWNDEQGHFVASFGGKELDASLLQMVDVGFIQPDDARFQATLRAIERDLRRGAFLLRYAEPDDFGEPKTAFNFCTFWLIEALALCGRKEEARELYEQMTRRLTHAQLMSEDMDPVTGELWGNYPQSYALVGLINSAVMLSKPWRTVR